MILNLKDLGDSYSFDYRGQTIPIPKNARIINEFGHARPHIIIDGYEKKWCRTCREWISVCYFYQDNTADGLCGQCSSCRGKQAKKEKRNIVYHYGIFILILLTDNRLQRQQHTRPV